MSTKVEASLVYWNTSGFMQARVWELEQETSQERTHNSSTYSYPIGGTNTQEVTRWVKKTLLATVTLSNAQLEDIDVVVEPSTGESSIAL